MIQRLPPLLAVFLGTWLALGILTHREPGSWNDRSRLALVESLVERRTFIIDEAIDPGPFATGDKLYREGHFYSDKLPNLQLLACAPYGILAALGVTFRGQMGWAYWLVTWLTAGACGAGVATLLASHARRLGLPLWWGPAGVGLTLLLPYSVTFNAHGPTALCLLAGWGMLRRWRAGEALGPWTLALWGFVASLGATFEAPPGGVFWLLGCVAIGWPRPGEPWLFRARCLALYGAGTVLPLLSHFPANHAATGSLLPSYMLPELWRSGHWLVRQAENFDTITPLMALDYLRITLVSTRGFFFKTPLMALGLWGLLRLGRGWGAAGVAGTMLFYATSTTSLGGVGYGIRYFAALTPICWAGLMEWRSGLPPWAEWPRWRQGLIVALALWCAATALIGAWEPWPITIVPVGPRAMP